jgi:hypothetical protein
MIPVLAGAVFVASVAAVTWWWTGRQGRRQAEFDARWDAFVDAMRHISGEMKR